MAAPGRLDAALEALQAWSDAQPQVEARFGPPLTDDAIDAAFAAIRSPHGAFSFTPRGEYREFLRRHDGVLVAARGGGPLDDFELRVFDLATVARAQRDHVFLPSPWMQTGSGPEARRRFVSRDHLLAFAGGRHAPDILHVFDTRADPSDHILLLDPDAAAYGGSTLLVDADGAWLPPPPRPGGITFGAWLLGFVYALRNTDFSDLV